MQITRRYRIVFLFSTVLIGGLLRFTNVNWDSFQAFHPDERNIAWAVTRIHFFDQMNPKFFAYGGLPIYLYRAIGEVSVAVTKDPSWIFEWGKIAVLGRFVSALLSTVSLYLIFRVGSSYFSSETGLLSALLLAFSPWAIREAHFATTETALVFFLLVLLLLSLKLLKQPSKQLAIATGLVLGLAIGAKTTSLLFSVIPLTALGLSFLDKSLHMRHFVKVSVVPAMSHASALLGTASIVFFLASPYTILDWEHFRESMLYETGVALGKLQVVYTLQFLHTTPYVYQLKTMLWQAGPVAILGVVGLLMLLVSSMQVIVKEKRRNEQARWRLTQARATALRSTETLPWKVFTVLKSIVGKVSLSEVWESGRDHNGSNRTSPNNASPEPNASSLLLLLIFPLVYGAWSGSWYAKFARYTVPLLPFATIAAAWLTVSLYKRKKRYLAVHVILSCFLAFLLVLHIMWGLANWAIYLRPQTRIEASRWMYKNIPKDAVIYTEHWNDGLPVVVDGIPHPGYNRETLTVYEPDNADKLDYYVDRLSKGDFIILSTRRMWATLPNLSERYPLTSIFYTKLLYGNLGYREVATFTAYPSLLGIMINDDASEESVQVFDHPTVRIFQNTEKFNEEEIKRQLQPSLLNEKLIAP